MEGACNRSEEVSKRSSDNFLESSRAIDEIVKDFLPAQLFCLYFALCTEIALAQRTFVSDGSLVCHLLELEQSIFTHYCFEIATITSHAFLLRPCLNQ
jgi:hypothetical protein